MDLFDSGKNKKEPEAPELLEKHNKGELTDELFLRDFGKAQVFYSTPFGDHKDGGQRVFLLPGPNNTGYHPVFSSQERLMEFYKKAGRVGYVIMKGPFASVVDTTNKSNAKAPIKMGIIIDPMYFGVTVDAEVLGAALNMMR